jgi:hypothetical protein
MSNDDSLPALLSSGGFEKLKQPRMIEILGCMKESKQYGKAKKTGNKPELAIKYRRLLARVRLSYSISSR